MINRITLILQGKQPQTYDLDQFKKDTVLMGRGPQHGSGGPPNDIRIPDEAEYISRSQCFFQRDPLGNWSITDDQSANGMYFQNRKVTERYLQDGDRIHIGAAQNAGRSLIILFSKTSEAREKSGDSIGGEYKGTDLKEHSRYVIGRSSDCDLVLSHPTVSRHHCIISQENGQFLIADNHSTNGVLLNSVSLERKTPLKNMDRISIADYSFVFNEGILYSHQLSGGVGITVSHLTKAVGKKNAQKVITNDVSLSIDPDQFVAIIGGSGAGKTTLLNCIAGLTDFTSGEILINGDSIRTGSKSLRSLMGFVPQQDIVYESLSLEKMLYYSARLRMPKDTSEEDIERNIKETLDTVELTAHRKTMISKLSGGQKKRASIAVELLASPKLFFLDEPSSGLDPGTEKHLMQMLRRLSRQGRTVIMVTHTVQNIDLCDKVICMGNGGLLCFSGKPSDALSFFGVKGMSDIYDDLNENSKKTSERFKQSSPKIAMEENAGAVSRKQKEKKRIDGKSVAAVFEDFAVMTRRYVEILTNTPVRLALLLALPVILSLLVCVAFQADGNIYNLLWKIGIPFNRTVLPFHVAVDTQKLLFAFSCAVFWTGIFNSIQEISKERTIYERERFSGVGALPYVMSKFVPLTVLCMIQSAVMTLLLTLMTNTYATVDGNKNSVTALHISMPADGAVFKHGLMWLEILLTTFLCALSAMCLGLLISAMVSNEIALILCPICLMPQILFSGIVGDLTGLTEFISNFVSCRWSCTAYCVSSGINNLLKTCAYKSGVWESTTFSDNGGAGLLDASYDLIHDYSLGMSNIGYSWFVLFFMSAVCVIAAILILRFRKETRK